MLKNHGSFLKSFWTLLRPYWVSEDKWKAGGLLAVIVGMNLGLVYVSVLFNEWSNKFYNSLQDKDYDAFIRQIEIFAGLALIHILVAVYQLYLRQMLQIKWRRWLTDHFIADWLGGRAYYLMQLSGQGADNPDQRIADDVDQFVASTLSLSLGLLSSVVSLVSFAFILWGLSGAVELWGISIPGYLFWICLLYAAVGSWLIDKIGRPLVGLNFNQQKFEADFRFSLIRLRENTEAVALYRGEPDETRRLSGRFGNIIANWWAIMRQQKRMTFFSSGYNQIAIIFPYVVLAPRYFLGQVALGGMMQTASAFGEVRASLSWFIEAYSSLAEWKATVDRLLTFRSAAEGARDVGEGHKTIERQEEAGASLAIENLSLALPNGQSLFKGLSLNFAPGESVLLTGPNGSGKSTLLRTLAGLWPFGSGRVALPQGGNLMFLPQRPYLPIDTLKAAVAYPAHDGEFSDNAVIEVLTLVGLGEFVARLDENQHWGNVLSGGEQQRLSIARALLHRPRWLFLDEATSAIDEDGEAALYRLLHQRLPGTAIISIGHRGSLVALHGRHLNLPDYWQAEAALA